MCIRDRDMIRHQHIGITDFFVHLDRFDEIHITLIRVYLHEIIAMAANVAEMYVEYLVAGTKIANDVEDLHAGILEHFREMCIRDRCEMGPKNPEQMVAERNV